MLLFNTALNPKDLLKLLKAFHDCEVDAAPFLLLDENLPGIDGEISKLINLSFLRCKYVLKEIRRAKEAVSSGDLKARAKHEIIGGPQKRVLEYFNETIEDLTFPVEVMAKVVTSVADGNLNLDIENDKLVASFLM